MLTRLSCTEVSPRERLPEAPHAWGGGSWGAETARRSLKFGDGSGRVPEFRAGHGIWSCLAFCSVGLNVCAPSPCRPRQPSVRSSALCARRLQRL